MFGADRVPIFSGACYRLTLTVESKSRNAANAYKSMRAVVKNESKKKS
jgi:hypothetical protein